MRVARHYMWMLLSFSLVLPFGVQGFAQAPATRRHRVIVRPGPNDSIAQIKQSGITNVDSYGSYWLVEATGAQVDALKKTLGDRASEADHLNRIELGSISLDTTAPEPVVPANLQQTAPAGKRLRLIQFKGPIQSEWLEEVKAVGQVKVISYVPNNAYVIWLDETAESDLHKLEVPSGPIQWIGAYHPYYKMDPLLPRATGSSIDVQVGVVNDPGAEQTLQAISGYALEQPGKPGVMANQIVTKISMSPVDLPAIAQMPDVLWIQRSAPLEKKDEVQDLIMADRISTLPGHSPVAGVDDYLDFLTNVVGFSTNPAEYPILDVADTLATATALFNDFFEFGSPSNSTRLAGFVSLCEPTAILCDNLHGPFVMSVASGYNDSKTDPVNLDSSGFRKGLGVSPFGRVANTIVFNLSGNLCVFCVPNSRHPSLRDIPLNEYQDFGARISNNSWGQTPVAGNGGNLGIYDGDSLSYDVTVRDALDSGSSVANTNGVTPSPFRLNQEMITVFAAGNVQGLGNNNGGFGDILVTPPATAKNVISVGASENVRSSTDANECVPFPSEADNSFDVSFFSSFGPTLDGRFKPEIVAPGSGIFGVNGFATNFFILVGTNLVPATGNAYFCANGTSFAAPAVSGAAQLLWWWFEHRLQNEQGQNFFQPSPAMAKAYLCNSARYLLITNPQTGIPDTLPSSAQGMGIVDLARMFDSVPRLIRDETTPRAIDSPLTATNPVPQQTFFNRSGQSYEVSGSMADSTQPFRATLAWTDAPGNPIAFKQLVNDLDLEVTVGGQTYKGNIFIGPNSVISGSAADSLNNMESVFLPAGQTGTWSVVVRAANIAGMGVPNPENAVGQDFALVVYNASDAVATRSDVANLSTNDSCQNALDITSFPFIFTNNLTKALYHNVHPSPSAARGGVEEFFRINRPTMGSQFTFDTFGSGFDTVLSVWRVRVVPQSLFVSGPCGALLELVSNDNTNSTLQSQVSFTADGSNTYYVVVEPHNDGAGGTMVLNVQGTSSITLSPTNLVFGAQVGGTTSAVQTVTYQNLAPVGVNIADVAIEGANPSDFLLLSQNCTGNAIPSGSSCTMSIAFAPTTTGLRTARLVVRDDATGSPRIAFLSGTGLPPSPLVCLNSSSVAFGGQGIGTTSSVHSVIITNCGTAALTVTGAGITGANASDFHIVANSCGSVAAGGTCSIGLNFTPTASGARAATLAISNSASGSPHLVSLTGTGSIGQPDAAIGKTTKVKKMVGNGVISTTGVGEEFVQKVKRGAKRGRRFFITLKNIGTSADQFKVEGDGDSAGFTVKYFLGAADTTDISVAVEAGAHASSTLAPAAITGDATMIRIEVFADRAVPKGTVKTFTIEFASVADSAKVDAVKATVIAK